MLKTCLGKRMSSSPACVLIHGYEETRYLHVLRELQAKVFTWDTVKGLSVSGQGSLVMPVAALRFIRDDAAPAGTYVLCDFAVYLENPTVIRYLKEIIYAYRNGSEKNLVLISPVNYLPTEIEKDVEVVDAPLPAAREIYLNLTHTVDQLVKSGITTGAFFRKNEIGAVIRALKGLTTQQIDAVLAQSIFEAGRISSAFIRKKKAQLLNESGLLELVDLENYGGLHEIGGVHRLKRWLQVRGKVFNAVKKSEQTDTVSIERFQIPSPKGLILAGFQGCGKSLLAKLVAKEWNLPLLRLDMGKVFTSRVGQSEEHMRKVLTIVESMQPCVLFIDEFEKAFAGVASSGLTDGGTASRVIGHFLYWLQEHRTRTFVIAASNDIQLLPPEIMRKGRFDEIFYISLPNYEERKEICAVVLKKHNLYHLVPWVDDFADSSEGFSGAELEQAIIDTLYEAFDSQQPPERENLQAILHRTVPLSALRSEEFERMRQQFEGRCIPASDSGKAAENKSHIIDFNKVEVNG